MTTPSEGQQALDLLRRIAEALERNNDLRYPPPPSPPKEKK